MKTSILETKPFLRELEKWAEFMNQEARCYEDVRSLQVDLQIQRNPSQNLSRFLWKLSQAIKCRKCRVPRLAVTLGVLGGEDGAA